MTKLNAIEKLRRHRQSKTDHLHRDLTIFCLLANIICKLRVKIIQRNRRICKGCASVSSLDHTGQHSRTLSSCARRRVPQTREYVRRCDILVLPFSPLLAVPYSPNANPSSFRCPVCRRVGHASPKYRCLAEPYSRGITGLPCTRTPYCHASW